MGLTSSHGSCLSSDTAVEPSASSRGTPRVRVPKKNRTTTPLDTVPPTPTDESYVTEYEYDEGGSAIYWPSSSLDDDRDDVVAFDFSAGSEFLAVDSFMDPCSLVGYEVHVEGEGTFDGTAARLPARRLQLLSCPDNRPDRGGPHRVREQAVVRGGVV